MDAVTQRYPIDTRSPARALVGNDFLTKEKPQRGTRRKTFSFGAIACITCYLYFIGS